MGLGSNEVLGVGVDGRLFTDGVSARLCVMNARVDILLDQALNLPPEERSAVALALLDSLEGTDDRAISDAWRTELLQRRARLRSGAVKAAPWAEARARMNGL